MPSILQGDANVCSGKLFGHPRRCRGSPASHYAVDWAAHDAALRGLPLTIVHAVYPIGITLPHVQAPSAFARRQVEQVQKWLDAAVEIARKITADGGPAQVNGEMLFARVVPNPGRFIQGGTDGRR